MEGKIQLRSLEAEIKSSVINYLIDQNFLNSDASIVSEFNVGDFSRRVDLALIRPNRMMAFEIKSEADSLIRLKGQINKYLEYFDKVTVVVAPKYVSKVIEATPLNVAVWEIDGALIRVKRKGRIVPINDKTKLIEMMGVGELASLVRELGLPLENRYRQTLEKVLLRASVSTLKNAVLKSIFSKNQKKNRAFLEKIKYKKVSPGDLVALRSSRVVHIHEDVRTDIESLIEAVDLISVDLKNDGQSIQSSSESSSLVSKE